MLPDSHVFCAFPLLTSHYSGLTAANMLGLGVSQVFLSLENEEDAG